MLPCETKRNIITDISDCGAIVANDVTSVIYIPLNI